MILGLPWISTKDPYIGCHFADMCISHGDARKKVTLYPPARSTQDLCDTLWLDYDSSDEEIQYLSKVHQYIECTEESVIRYFLSKLDTMQDFRLLRQNFSLGFQENCDPQSSTSLQSLQTPHIFMSMTLLLLR